MQQAIRFVRYLAADGVLGEKPPDEFCAEERLLAAYRTMVLIRRFDRKAIALQRTGQLGTYASALGQEAIGVAIGLTMLAKDVLVPYYRDYAAQYLRGVRLAEILTYWGGDERGSNYGAGLEDLPMCVPVATQCGHAAGVATALKMREQSRVAVVTLGDGATSKGDFLEALNLAGVWHLPLVFVVNNNGYAISVPRSAQSAAPTLAHKALGAGVSGVQVDGNDVFALQVEIDRALSRARANKGATLIEAISYRLSDHTTADDASRYRSSDEVKSAWANEPIARLRAFLTASGLWHEERERALMAECDIAVSEAVDEYLSLPAAPPEDLFDYHFATLPAHLKGQRAQAMRKANRHGGSSDG